MAGRDWGRISERIRHIAHTVNDPGAPVNLVERIGQKLRELSALGYLDDAPLLAIPKDPLRDARFQPPMTPASNRQ
ncbi:hypothetical protein [Mycolicibacterium vinylchloridicum]|uniref:hypothetical protein n=1 Tax=Mycolicibacterium vinylchloridicum TaxID=2736928 RepID=UPI00022E36BA|nr:hypothetical protein [Mycolicibacterium vinylchloridicum]EHB46420.1 hypothetical protein MycrhDRAFT_6224 [Mycolicibacterium rhodesiae JS60]